MAARNTVSTHIRPYITRMVEEAYAHIEQEAAEYDGSEPVDWISVGEAAAYRALTSYGVSLPAHKVNAISQALKAGGAPALNQAHA